MDGVVEGGEAGGVGGAAGGEVVFIPDFEVRDAGVAAKARSCVTSPGRKSIG